MDQPDDFCKLRLSTSRFIAKLGCTECARTWSMYYFQISDQQVDNRARREDRRIILSPGTDFLAGEKVGRVLPIRKEYPISGIGVFGSNLVTIQECTSLGGQTSWRANLSNCVTHHTCHREFIQYNASMVTHRVDIVGKGNDFCLADISIQLSCGPTPPPCR